MSRYAERIALFAVMAAVLLGLWWLKHRADECANWGGVLVRGMFLLECVKVEQVKP